MRRLALGVAAAALAAACGAPAKSGSRHALRDAPRDERGEGSSSQSGELRIRRLVEGAWVLTQSSPWSANALLVEMDNGDLVLVDTLYTPSAMKELLAWIGQRYPTRRLMAINTHFHSDRTGGNAALLERKIPVYASDLTVKLMKSRGRAVMEGVAHAIADDAAKAAYLAAPIAPADSTFSLQAGLKLSLGQDELQIHFPGPGHSPDNVVVYFPQKKLLFGGCLVLSADRVGNTSDADLPGWSKALDSLSAFPAEHVIPGHGHVYDPALVDRSAAAVDAKRASL